MDIERKERRRKVRLAITETIMVVAVIIVVGVLFAIVTGWRVNGDLSVEQYGQVDIRSYPTGASIAVDGDLQSFAFTNTSRMLTEGGHNIKLEKNEFDSWEKTVKVIPGWAVRLRYPRLFRQEREVEEVTALGNDDFLMTSPGRENILYGNKKGLWKWMSVRGDDSRITDIDVTEIIGNDEPKKMIWAWGSERLLVQTKDNEWIVIYLTRAKDSVKLGKYDKVLFMDGSGSRVWALKDQVLYSVGVGASGDIKKMVEGVEDFAVNEKEVIYLSKKRKLMLYHEGDEKGVDLKIEVPEGEQVQMMTAEYAGEKYVGVVVGAKWMIYRMDDYPMREEDLQNMKLVVERDLGESPSRESVVSHNGEFFIVRKAGKIVVFDAELIECTEYDYPANEIWWLDDYMLTNVENEALVTRDFDGTNKRILVKAGAIEYPAMVTANNKWLYYVSRDESNLQIVREQVN